MKTKKSKKERKLKRDYKSSESDENDAFLSSKRKDCYSSTNVKQPERDEWMTLNAAFKTQTRDEWKLEQGSSRKMLKLEEKKKQQNEYKPGSHSRELNKYFKDGGSGLPSNKSSDGGNNSNSVSVYDASWLRRALERAKQQAKDESRSLEDVAKERWGSLETFYKLLDEAEGSSKIVKSSKDSGSSHRHSTGSKVLEHHRNRGREKNIEAGQPERQKGRKKWKKRRQRPSSSSSSSSSDSARSNSNSDSSEVSEKRKDVRTYIRDRKQGMMKPGSDDEEDRSKPSTDARSLKGNERSRHSSWRKNREEHSGKENLEEKNDFEKSKSFDSKPLNEEAKELPVKEMVALSDKEMNKLGAKITKAELMGNQELAEKLKAKLNAAREARSNMSIGDSAAQGQQQIVLLSRTDKTGFTRPVLETFSTHSGPHRSKGKKSKPNMYDSEGQRSSYFADDSRVNLRQMFEKEKGSKVEDELNILKSLATCRMEKLTDDFDVDDMYAEKVCPKESSEKEALRDRERAIQEHEKMERTLDSCHYCFGNKLLKKHLIVSLGSKCYLSVPPYLSLTEGQCFIAPLSHVTCSLQADEDVWEEIMTIRQSLVNMFSSLDQDCIFFETASGLSQIPHMVIHCIPMPRETGELAPIYFKKAIMECESEWSVNKKLIELKSGGVRRSIPKGLPYFWVDFGLSPGFAHVIEDERLFPRNFAQEIACGMMEADYSKFRKPKMEDFDKQRIKNLNFTSRFKSFDPNR